MEAALWHNLTRCANLPFKPCPVSFRPAMLRQLAFATSVLAGFDHFIGDDKGVAFLAAMVSRMARHLRP
jgi:hypothetical protein